MEYNIRLNEIYKEVKNIKEEIGTTTSDLNDELRDIRQQVTTIGSTTTETSRKLDQLSTALSDMRDNNNTTYVNQIRNLEEKLNEHNTKLDANNMKLQTYNTTLAATQSKFDSSDSILKEIRTQISTQNLHREVDRVANIITEKFKTQKAKIESTTSKLTDLHQLAVASTNDSNAIKDTLNDIRATQGHAMQKVGEVERIMVEQEPNLDLIGNLNENVALQIEVDERVKKLERRNRSLNQQLDNTPICCNIM
ncbi:hypothetical protein Plec18170_000893 [Paecilomyces lecythidis]